MGGGGRERLGERGGSKGLQDFVCVCVCACVCVCVHACVCVCMSTYTCTCVDEGE